MKVKHLRNIIMLSLITFMVMLNVPLIQAAPTLEETKKLLQKGLTIYEIDQEVSRITLKEEEIVEQIKETSMKIKKQDQLVEQTRKRAGEVLRAYYTGERTSIWMTLLLTDSFTDALDLYEYLQRIFEHDHKTFEAYVSTYKELQDFQQELTAVQTDLRLIKAEFLKQRERLVSLQKEVEEELKAIPEADAKEIVKQIEILTEEWKTVGLPLFNRYLKALGKVLVQLPEIISENKEVLSIQGFKYKLTIKEKLFNDFLLSKNPEMFQHFTFQFGEGQLIIKGRMDQIDLSIKAHFQLVEKPNAILVSIDKLTFNNFILPDTTRDSLQEQYDLALYPNMLFSFLYATEVEMKEDVLIIKLKAD